MSTGMNHEICISLTYIFLSFMLELFQMNVYDWWKCTIALDDVAMQVMFAEESLHKLYSIFIYFKCIESRSAQPIILINYTMISKSPQYLPSHTYIWLKQAQNLSSNCLGWCLLKHLLLIDMAHCRMDTQCYLISNGRFNFITWSGRTNMAVLYCNQIYMHHL